MEKGVRQAGAGVSGWLPLVVVGAVVWMTGCAGAGPSEHRWVLADGEGSAERAYARGCFAWKSPPDEFQRVEQSADLEEEDCLQASEALTAPRAQKLWQSLARTRTTLQNFAPRRTLAHLLGPLLFEKQEVAYSELLLRMKGYARLVVMRPDGYLALATTGKPLQRMGRVELREGRLMAGRYEVGAFFWDNGGVFYRVDASLQQGGMLGELGLEHDLISSALDGAEDAIGQVALALAQLLTSPVRSLEGLKQLPSAVAGLIASSPSYFEHYSALPLEEQVREAARLSTHLLMLYGSAVGTTSRLGVAGSELSVLSLTAEGALAMEPVALASATPAAVLGTGAGAVYVLTGRGKPPEEGQVSGAPKRVGGGFKAFTEDNFRENLSRLTGELPENSHAHHVFPQKLEERFQEVGINVHDPRFGAWWEKSSHLKNATAYNKLWVKFLKNNPTVEQILEYGRHLAGKYEFQVHF